MSHGGHLPDLYKYPPTELQSFDDWQRETLDESAENDVPEFLYMMETHSEQSVELEPEPDYSDPESDDTQSSSDEVDNAQTHKDGIKMKLKTLTKDDYDKIIAAAEAQLGLSTPEPDYQDDDDDDNRVQNGNSPLDIPCDMAHILMPVEGNEEELISPKKLTNPCLESREKKDLHRELLMNQKLGVDVLHRKSELKKKFEQRKEAVKKKELEDRLRSKRTSLEVRLEEQANRLKAVEGGTKHSEMPSSKTETSEFHKVHSKIKTKLSR